MDIPQELTVRVGESKSLVLPGLGTAGYRWDSTVGGDAVSTDWVRGVPPGAARGAAVGASAPEKVTLTGVHPGTAVVELTQARGWESADNALQRHRIVVTVID